MTIKIKLRRGTEAQWTAANTVLSDGEPGFETDTNKFKIGTGTASWNDLPYSAIDPSTASATYLRQDSASAQYLTKTSAASTYFPISSSANFAPLTISTNAQTGTSYTLGLSDAGKIIERNNAGANLVIIPLNSTAAFPVGTKIDIIQTGAGATSASVTSGVTLNSEAGKRTINAQWQAATLVKRGTDTWVMIGALKT